jgi:hypothetical protein
MRVWMAPGRRAVYGYAKPLSTECRAGTTATFRGAAFVVLRVGEGGANAMANILVNVEKGIEIGAEDALKWLIGAGKALHAAPAAVAALATLAAALEKPLAELAGAAANPLNVPLDIQTAHDLKAAWPEVKAFLKSLGVKM